MIAGQHAPKGNLAGNRTRSPRETFDEYRRFMPEMGITRIADITGLDYIGIPVSIAIRPNSRAMSTSQGKGIDVDSARTAALMEAIESWHAEHIDRPLRWDSFASLRRDTHVADVTRLPLCLGGKLRPELPQLWIEGFDIMQGRPCWVPFDLVTSYYVEPMAPGQHARSSIGLASGNHLLEAIVHGLCEVIERDAEELWNACDDIRQVALETVDAEDVRTLLERIHAAGVSCFAFDITSDTGIPTFLCSIMERPVRGALRALGIHSGSGCHLSAAVALSRAIVEAAQTRLTFISGSRDDLYREGYTRSKQPEVLEEMWTVASGNATHPLDAARCSPTDSFEGDLRVLLDSLGRIGIESVIAVDLTKDRFRIPVVRVIVPGLEAGSEVSEQGDRVRQRMERRS